MDRRIADKGRGMRLLTMACVMTCAGCAAPKHGPDGAYSASTKRPVAARSSRAEKGPPRPATKLHLDIRLDLLWEYMVSNALMEAEVGGIAEPRLRAEAEARAVERARSEYLKFVDELDELLFRKKYQVYRRGQQLLHLQNYPHWLFREGSAVSQPASSPSATQSQDGKAVP